MQANNSHSYVPRKWRLASRRQDNKGRLYVTQSKFNELGERKKARYIPCGSYDLPTRII